MRVGRYELVRLLGAGGQGRVYEAVQEGPGAVRRTVALKVLPIRAPAQRVGVAGPAPRAVPGGERLRREARIGGLLRHPHLVDVYEVGEADGVSYCAMEYCRGGTLAEWMPLPARAVVDVALQVCAALQYAHAELGLVHQDLKPSNLLLDGTVVKVGDLGVARVSELEDDGKVRGTPGYMAPEQARGEPVDARADVYALGVVLHELLVGLRPAASVTFTVDGVETGWADAGERVPLVGAAALLAPVLERCLDPDPCGRFASMAELAEALRALEVEGPTLAEVVPAAATPEVRDPELFVGRRDELGELAEALAGPGVVTLKGAAGIGKTSLARRYARDRAGAWFCDLAEVRTLSGLLHAVGAGLGVPLGPGGDDELVERLGHAIAARPSPLVVLDNFEQLVVFAQVLVRWAEAAPGAGFLVTSREALRVPGERVVEVGPLSEDDAVALLVAHAERRGADVGLDPAVRALARRLEGVPLALELCAGRLGVLTPAEVLGRLSLSLLRTGRTDVSGRQATLRGALDWSWELLDPPQRSALVQLTVFAGGFTVDAAAAVVALPREAPPIEEVLGALRDRSLVAVRGGRLAMLDVVRAHAAEHLEDPVAVEVRHGACFASLGSDEALDALRLRGGTQRLRALAPELDNLVTACRAAVRRGDAPVAAATCRAAWEVLVQRGPFAPGAELADAVLALRSLEPGLRARVEAIAAHAKGSLGRPDEGRAHLEAALALHREQGELAWEGRTLANLGRSSIDLGRTDEAETLLAAAVAVHREAADRRYEGTALAHLGVLRLVQGRTEDARGYLEASLERLREVGDRATEGQVLGTLGVVASDQGRLDDARVLYEAALAVHGEVGSRAAEGRVLGTLAALHRASGRVSEAHRNYDLALALLREIGDRRFEGQVLANLANLLRDEGRLDEARRSYGIALARHREVRDRRAESLALRNLAALDVEEGRLDEAMSALEGALRITIDIGDGRSEGLVLACCANVHRLAGRLADARSSAAAADGVLRRAGDRADLAELACVLAEIEQDAGAPAAAQAALAEAEALAGERGAAPSSPLGAVLARVRARVGPASAGCDPVEGAGSARELEHPRRQIQR